MKLFYLLLPVFFFGVTNSNTPKPDGAWQNISGDVTTILLIKDGYFTSSSYTKSTFKETWGGIFKTEGNKILIRQQFNTAEKELKNKSISYVLKNKTLTADGKKFDQIDDGVAPLSGVWRITGRMNDGKISQIHQTGTRQTLKVLTGTRFQWFAIDPDGNKFSGTGGGTYSFKNGRYIENIDFFSRDASRVGASLSFDDHLEGAKWHHTGLSSRGDKIYEIWEKTDIKY